MTYSNVMLRIILLMGLLSLAFNLPIQGADPQPACRFPGPWQQHPDGNPLKVNYSGVYDDDPVGKALMKILYRADFENFHHVGLICDPFVIYDKGRFEMWFSGMKRIPEILTDVGLNQGNETMLQGVAYSESIDGLLWSDPKHREQGIELVLEPTPGGWDRFGLETVTVVKHPSTGEYMLYYTGKDGIDDRTSTFAGIGLARSSDGIHWTKHPEPVLRPQNAWEQPFVFPEDFPDTTLAGSRSGGILEPTVLYDKRERLFKMWYAGMGIPDGTMTSWSTRIGYAESPDGIHWERRAEPVFVSAGSGEWDSDWVSHCHVIQDPQHGFHLFYASESKGSGVYGIGHAYSEDGIHWERNPHNPILENTKCSWHNALTGGPSALFVGDTLYLWYFGSQKTDFSYVYFGLATAHYKEK